jgi:hypothetical protein
MQSGDNENSLTIEQRSELIALADRNLPPEEEKAELVGILGAALAARTSKLTVCSGCNCKTNERTCQDWLVNDHTGRIIGPSGAPTIEDCHYTQRWVCFVRSLVR